jgi:hypothetical protein
VVTKELAYLIKKRQNNAHRNCAYLSKSTSYAELKIKWNENVICQTETNTSFFVKWLDNKLKSTNVLLTKLQECYKCNQANLRAKIIYCMLSVT